MTLSSIWVFTYHDANQSTLSILSFIWVFSYCTNPSTHTTQSSIEVFPYHCTNPLTLTTQSSIWVFPFHFANPSTLAVLPSINVSQSLCQPINACCPSFHQGFPIIVPPHQRLLPYLPSRFPNHCANPSTLAALSSIKVSLSLCHCAL